MIRRPTQRRLGRIATAALVSVVLASACSAPSAPRDAPSADGARGARDPSRTKTITVGITGMQQAMGVMGATTTSGGWHSMNEIHSAALTTTDYATRRPIGRLAELAPSTDDGSVTLLPDGRMRVVFNLRRGITWHDGMPFTAQDLIFSYQLNGDRAVAPAQRDTITFMQSVEAPDDHTFVVYYKSPYFLGAMLGPREFWPQPRHILGEPYARYLASGDPDEVANLRYWTTEYIHLGPFRLTSFDPGEGTEYRAYDGYFLGPPRVDVIRVRSFAEPQALFANLLAGTVDIFADSALSTELGFQLKDRWEASGEGAVYVLQGFTRFLAPQWRPAFQMEPAIFDVRVRAALYQGIDRDSLSEREAAAWSLLPPDDPLYESTKDGFRRYAYDPDRARAILRDVGWVAGSDGAMRSGDGRRFRTSIWNTPGGRSWETAVYADYWRRIGLEVEEFTVPAARSRDSEFRASYPGWEASSSGQGDGILGRIEWPPASAQTRWIGERGGYDDPRAHALLDRYRSSLSQRDQLQTMRAISDFVVAELPFLATYYTADHIGASKRVKVLDDVGGGAIASSAPFGTYTRNAHTWDVTL